MGRVLQVKGARGAPRCLTQCTSFADASQLEQSLRAIPFHENIIPLYDFFLLPTTKELYFVFESMEGNLYHLIKARKGRPFAGGLVSSIFRQTVSGLDHIHAHGYFHRDMKPENVLVTTVGLFDYTPVSPVAPPNAPKERDVVAIIKLADFGLARETNSRPPYTEYVSTRWYRAPEVLLLSREYSNPVDMWALGTIMAELVNLRPLFPGSDQVDQVARICEVLGDPSDAYSCDKDGSIIGGGPWPQGIRLARDVGFSFTPVCHTYFSHCRHLLMLFIDASQGYLLAFRQVGAPFFDPMHSGPAPVRPCETINKPGMSRSPIPPRNPPPQRHPHAVWPSRLGLAILHTNDVLSTQRKLVAAFPGIPYPAEYPSIAFKLYTTRSSASTSPCPRNPPSTTSAPCSPECPPQPSHCILGTVHITTAAAVGLSDGHIPSARRIKAPAKWTRQSGSFNGPRVYWTGRSASAPRASACPAQAQVLWYEEEQMGLGYVRWRQGTPSSCRRVYSSWNSQTLAINKYRQ